MNDKKKKKIFNFKKKNKKKTRLNDVKARPGLCACSFYYFFVVCLIKFFLSNNVHDILFTSLVFYDLRVIKKIEKGFFNSNNIFLIIFLPKNTYKTT